MRLTGLPLFPSCLAVLAVAMLAPALVGLVQRDWESARTFLYAAIFTGFAAGILGVALAAGPRLAQAQRELLTLLAAWLVLPVFAAIPLALLTPSIGAFGAWFEMVASFTTTGGTVYADVEGLAPAINLWRGIMGWLGGLLTLTAAFVIMAPRRLGGFEVLAISAPVETDGGQQIALTAAARPVSERLARALRHVVPVYAALTLALLLIFNALGKGELVGAVHAMSIVSTSGISPLNDGLAAERSVLLEIAAALFLVVVATRAVFAARGQRSTAQHWTADPELRLLAGLTLAATLVLVLRHWFGVLTIETGEAGTDLLKAVWGAFFTALSFLTTTGFTSAYWESARDWSGLANPGLVLLGLCAVGGGAATTAGGIKLIRAWALMRHGVREVERLAQPQAVLGVGDDMRSVQREGAQIAWAFMMLYVLAVFLLTLALTITGLTFTDALIGANAAITNTGPAFDLILEGQESFSLITNPQRAILAIAMVLGRIETLAVIALISPEAWRALRHRKKISGKLGAQVPHSRW